MKNLVSFFIVVLVFSCSVSKPVLTDAQLVESFITQMKTAIKNKNINPVKQRIAYLSSDIDASDLAELAIKRGNRVSKDAFLKKINSDLESTFSKITKTLDENYKFKEVERIELSNEKIKEALEPLNYKVIYQNLYLIYSNGEKDYKVNFSGIVIKNNKLFFINGFHFGSKFR